MQMTFLNKLQIFTLILYTPLSIHCTLTPRHSMCSQRYTVTLDIQRQDQKVKVHKISFQLGSSVSASLFVVRVVFLNVIRLSSGHVASVIQLLS